MNEEPIYNIGVVARMTGIPQNTLRVWERRYSFPASTRSAGGHRLFSRLQVARVRWVKQRLDEGMQIRNAINALLQSEETGQFPNLAREFPSSAPSAVSSETFHHRLFDA